MPPTVLLCVLEPNLAILCVSIPTLRPLQAMVRARKSATRLPDPANGLHAGYRTSKSLVPSNVATLAQEDAWEMDGYHSPRNKHSYSASVSGESRGVEEDCSSQKNLTSTQRVAASIGIEKEWKVSRH